MATNKEDLLQNLWAARRLSERSPLSGYASIGRDELQALLIVSHQLDARAGIRLLPARARLREALPARAGDDGRGRDRREGRSQQATRPTRTTRTCTCAWSIAPSDGIVVRGAKAHTSGSVVSNELVIIPQRAMREADADYAVAFAVPDRHARPQARLPRLQRRPGGRVRAAGVEPRRPGRVVHDLRRRVRALGAGLPLRRVGVRGRRRQHVRERQPAGLPGRGRRQAAALHRRRSARGRAQRRRRRLARPRQDHPDDPARAVGLGLRRRRLARELARRAGIRHPGSRADERGQEHLRGGPLPWRPGSCSRSPAARS